MNKLILLLLVLTSIKGMAQKDFDKKIKSIVSGTIPYIHEDKLNQKMGEGEDIIILDTRTIAEYNISHLNGAKFIDYDGFKANMVEDLDKDKEVVVYCSVGYRSEKIGEKLRDMGFTNVKNLYGGIFDWKNNGNTVVTAPGAETDSVHTYNRNWSKWLIEGIKVYD